MSQRAYNVWTAKEVEALKRGVEAHGVGFWEQIRSDPQFEVLRGRTGVQLKDKWRNIVKFQRAAALRNEAASPASARWSRRGPRAVRTPSPPPSTAASPLPIFKEEPGVAERMYVAALAAACTTSALASRDPCPANIAACAAASADLHLARVRLLGAGAPCPSHAAGQRRSGSAPSVQGFDRGLAGPAGAHGPASLSPGEAEGVNPSGQLDQVLSAARQLSMDRMGSMNDSLVLDIAAFMELASVLPPELALPPAALLEMYHALGGEQRPRGPRRRLGGVELFDPGAPTAPDWASLLPGVLEGRQQPLAQETVAAVVAAMSAWN
ncbi:hypothetical protein F751_1830 [Auxenochlorella protothecoides]|uniref:Uncharacterized protein n=1 Tax=Auxenochlorella protothecoides TaxID=3075 RepID=A0A087SGU7_AUXPR|nr:hypothetical protein F751_1830 [Auxenochlorella protothecoides]KFM24951.1 hypothetical protein F751_1830 [Auxenochlorella protothecoides]